MDEGLPERVPGKFNNKIQRANGEPGRAGELAAYVDCVNQTRGANVPGTGPGQQLRGLQGLLGQVSKKYLLWRTLKWK